MQLKLTSKSQRDLERDLERVWKLRREAVALLDQIVAEWNSDPLSVQCFDLRLVQRSKELLAELKRYDFLGLK